MDRPSHGGNDFADGFITNVFDPSQTVNHRLVAHDELAAADLDIRLPDFNVIVLAGGNVLGGSYPDCRFPK